MINLFILKNCPYCRKVVDFLEINNIEHKLLNIDEKQNYDEMIKLGGKRQVPFLFNSKNNVVMYESNDIIEYLKTL